MTKIKQSYDQVKNKRTSTVLLGLFALMLVSSQASWGQQGTGEFSSKNGGFETIIPFVSAGTPVTGVERSAWGYVSGATIANNTTIVRSGANSLNMTIGSTSNYIVSPTAPTTAVASGASYIVQFYGWKNNTAGTARPVNVYITPDVTYGAASLTPAVGPNSALSTSWQKIAVVVTSGTGTATTRYGSVKIMGSGGSFANVLFDDFCMYAGSTVDVTAPDAVTAATASVAGVNVNVSWTAPGTGVDGGGYLVVRYNVLPNADNDPNVNGIYAAGNTITNGTGSLTGTVVYTGTATSFTDATVVNGGYYKIYTVDKAFNYSDEVQQTLGVNELSLSENNVSVYKNKEALYVNSDVAIANIKVFDIQGRLISELKNINATTASIKDLKESKQVLILKITSQDNKVVSKKVVH